MSPLLIKTFTTTTALGRGIAGTLDALRAQRSGLRERAWETVDITTCLGEVDSLDDVALRTDMQDFDCRNNRLAQLALEQDDFMPSVQDAAERYGRKRIGVFLGSSTSGILSSEQAYRQRDPISGALPANYSYQHTHSMFSVADFVRHYADLQGPAYVVSTACSSSAKVFGIAQRMIHCGLIDAAVVGGVDSLCLTTLYGFNSLQLISSRPCMPFDSQRDGISIGEGAAFILLERADHAQVDDILLSGVGESSDAHHMSAPHPQGLGARLAMQAALDMARLQPESIGYINLHGTATPSNDAAEDTGVTSVFGHTTPCSSTKGHTGHTLGAAGGIEAVVCALALHHNFLPGGVGTVTLDPRLHCNYLLANQERAITHALSNSFGFGGSNCSLLFSRKRA
ncbi:beta-ketoacyl-[acyl-carrier-protein] synthase family protein [Simplicispira psychrophila]|uniref:beta-ketoacyl-[acyl-carrier-protein] synthase family protein n=1 Tax=Simplicispira psychrophila TaxID=80882 RepID=UPI000486E1CE|nr:beta-ketoacyl-[acyl-carrier-protein] synthase family protein [Simplicispira psychrophila]